MLNRTMSKITGTFIQPLLGDTGIENRGLKEWEQDFRMLKAMGMDTLIIIRCECEQNGIRVSGLDPRSTTWPEDDNLLVISVTDAGITISCRFSQHEKELNSIFVNVEGRLTFFRFLQ